MIELFLRRTSRQIRQSSKKGFILPVVIVLSLAISSISITTLQTVSNSSTTLNDQYYKTLAREAAQAGLSAANACIKANSLNLWTDANPLGPKTNCLGVANTTGLNYVGKSSDGGGTGWESTYSVKAPLKTATNMTVISVGTVELKSASGTTLQTFSHSLKSAASIGGTVSKAVTDLTVGWAHVCAAAEGRAYCWGWNSSGQLGNASLTNASKPVEVSQATIATPAQPALPSGCGSFFNPCTTPAKPAVPASEMVGKNVTAIAAGTNHTCAIAEATVYCWGKNSSGQLGNGTTIDSLAPVKVYMNPIDIPAQPAGPSGCGGFFNPCTIPATPAIPKAALIDKIPIQISAGEDYTCVVAYPTTGTINDSRAYCWGKNADGQLGVNDKTNRTTPTPVYASNATPAQGALPAGCGGFFNPCTTPAQAAQPATPLWNKTVTEITAGTAHTCAITSDGTGSCWGIDTSGQIGSGQTPNTSTGATPQVTCSDGRNAGTVGTDPSDIPDIIAPKVIHTRDAYTYTDFFGNTQNVAASSLFNKKLLYINASGSYTNALADDGRVYWWGGQPPRKVSHTKHGYAYCSYRTTTGCKPDETSCVKYRNEWNSVNYSTWDFDIHDEPTGPIYKDQYKCWWLFTCKENNLLTNKQLKLVGGSANLGTFCALDLANIAYCDGTSFPYYGQRGDGTPLGYNWNELFQKSDPKLVDQSHILAGKTITEMEAGAYGNFTCVVANQAVYCWGINDVGEIGDGTIGTNNSKTVPTATDVTTSPLGKPGGVTMSSPITF